MLYVGAFREASVSSDSVVPAARVGEQHQLYVVLTRPQLGTAREGDHRIRTSSTTTNPGPQ